MSRCLISACFLCGFTAVWQAHAATFEARVSPPNFELKAVPGERIRHLIHIQNSDEESAEYLIRTADWDINAQGGVVIRPADAGLSENSCRPWSRIERGRIKLAPQQIKKYRFEIQVPADVSAGECRFAILISPTPDSIETTQLGNISIPIAGQIAIVVYVVIGDATANLEFRGARVIQGEDGRQAAYLDFFNSGNAHGRPFGNVNVEQSDGSNIELVVVPFPVLPGRTMPVGLQSMGGPEYSEPPPFQLSLPARMTGLIEWDGGNLKLDDAPLKEQ